MWVNFSRLTASKRSGQSRLSSLVLILALATLSPVFGQDKTAFPYLTRISIDKSLHVIFAYDKKSARLINQPCYLLSKSDPLHCDKDSELAEWVLVAKFKLHDSRDSVNILYSPGASDDPEFAIAKKPREILGQFSCLEFYINNLGTIYTSGHTNNMFDRRRKFQVQSDTVREITQPYSFVGLRGKALRDVTLYRDKTGDQVVAMVPKGYEIEILLAESTTEDYEVDLIYLAKTEFGLIGWLRLEGYDDRVLEGLFFNGD